MSLIRKFGGARRVTTLEDIFEKEEGDPLNELRDVLVKESNGPALALVERAAYEREKLQERLRISENAHERKDQERADLLRELDAFAGDNIILQQDNEDLQEDLDMCLAHIQALRDQVAELKRQREPDDNPPHLMARRIM